jgi:hypothetical protein
LAADSLAERGIHCRVLSVHTIKPLDTDTLAAAASETGGIISIEEHAVDGGLGGAIAESLMEAGYSLVSSSEWDSAILSHPLLAVKSIYGRSTRWMPHQSLEPCPQSWALTLRLS